MLTLHSTHNTHGICERQNLYIYIIHTDIMYSQ